MAAETDDNKKTFYRKPSPTLWTTSSLVIIFAVWCGLLPILAASGHLLNSQSFECGNSNEEASRLKKESLLVYLWSGLCLLSCILLLLEIWIRKSFFSVLLGAICVLFVIMILSFTKTWKEETLEIQAFKQRYLALIPLTDIPGNKQTNLNDTNCSILNNVYRWQAEFKCCGLEGYQDWGSMIPDSCLCEGEDNSSGCVGVGNSLVHEKPCLPTVLSLVGKRSSTFWIVMIVWITIIGAPVAIFLLALVVSFSLCSYWLFLNHVVINRVFGNTK
ncbi:uncharacterized protein LOC120798529 isoform X2 [Xiphias gladius]|uniref:uncharacterized protein LOC120798529 isoform X2 n=1 Tax=Xiphias gladius TaxID=8245 RepID=UPI001A99CF1B|nr:uncharacterized protein LOC120798529 isoform X2 [Xiphias gladius]